MTLQFDPAQATAGAAERWSAASPSRIVRLARSDEQRRAVYALRRAEYEAAGMNHLLAGESVNAAADVEDVASKIFYVSCGADCVACRVTPLTAAPQFASLVEPWLAPVSTEASVRIGRLVVSRSMRGSTLYKHLLGGVKAWLMTATTYELWVGQCDAALALLYVKIGGRVLGVRPSPRADGSEHPYAFVAGRIGATKVPDVTLDRSE